MESGNEVPLEITQDDVLEVFEDVDTNVENSNKLDEDLDSSRTNGVDESCENDLTDHVKLSITDSGPIDGHPMNPKPQNEPTSASSRSYPPSNRASGGLKAKQASGKESEAKEIKMLRKSLTFKATPMPKFYNEPPPKPVLKKIPPTRPRSPKLGRAKSSVAAVSKSLEQMETSHHSPRPTRARTMSPRPNTTGDKDSVGSKNPNRKSLSKTSHVKTEKGSKIENEEEPKACDEPAAEVEGCIETGESGVSSSTPDQDTTPVSN